MDKFKVYIIDNDNVVKLLLDSDLSTHYDSDYLSFDYDGAWYANCHKNYCFGCNKQKKIGEGVYQISSPDIFYSIGLIIFDAIDKEFELYSNKACLISNHPSSTIYVDDGPLNGYYIYLKEGKLIYNYPYILLNGHLYHGEGLKNHDYLEIANIKIIYNQEFLSIASDYAIKLKPYAIKFKAVDNYSKPRHLQKPRFKNFDFTYDVDLERYEVSKQYDNSYAAIQSILMTLGMLVISLINLFKNNHNTYLEIISAILMPCLMLMIAIFFPILQKRTRQNQLNKTNQIIKSHNQSKLEHIKFEYENNLKELLDLNAYYNFDYAVINKMLKNGDVYLANINTDTFLKINLGEYQYEPNVCINMRNQDDKLSQELEIFKNGLIRNIEINYIVDFKEYPKLIINGQRTKLLKYFKILLLEVVMTHNYHDLKIALVLDDDIDAREYLNIKHLFSTKRFIFYRKDNLEELYRFEEPILIMSFLEINIKADNQYLIYFNIHNSTYCTYDLIVNLDQYQLYDRHLDNLIKLDYLNFNCNFYATIENLNRFVIKDEISNFSYTLHDFYKLKPNYHQKRKGLWVSFSYNDAGLRKEYDLSEKGIGPHLLISGTTGSGKSELALSLILSLCLNYRADEVSLVLIDYKGTGLKETLSYQGEMLKHISLCLTNLNQNEFKRALRAFKVELERRESLFEKMAKLTNTSIMNIDDYNMQDCDYYGLTHLTHYFIVIDEFAELKSDKPSFMQEIITIARIGRSLGFHLILITQKVTTIVDEEIKANIATNICLKVNSISDSREMLNSDLAYKIKCPGEYYLYSNNNLDHGYSLYARSYDDKKHHKSVKIVDYKLQTLKSIEYISSNKIRQSSKYIALINDYHRNHHLNTSSIFLPKLEDVSFSSLLHKYKYSLCDGEYLMGEYDDYYHMQQNLLIHDFNKSRYVLTYFRNNTSKHQYTHNLIHSFNHSDYHIIMLCYDLKRYQEFKQRIELVDINEYKDVQYLLNKLMIEDKKILLIIDDYNAIKQDENNISSLFKLVLNINKTNIFIQIYTIYGQNIPFKFNGLFKIYLLDNPSKDELIMAYGQYNEVSSDMVFKHNHKYLVGFKMALNEEHAYNTYLDNYLFKIPEIISYELVDNQMLIGYRIDLRIKYYLNIRKKILFTAYYQDILNDYQKIFKHPNIDYIPYHLVDHNEYYDLIVWLGPNIHNQYLFRVKLNNDLKVDEAYVYDKPNGFVVKLVNDASNNKNT